MSSQGEQGKGRGTSFARSTGLVGLAVAALLALTASPASAKQVHLFATSFGEPGPGNGQLQLAAGSETSPGSGLAIDQGSHDIYVADTGNGRIEEFEPDGTFVRAFGTFTDPTLVAVDNSLAGEGDLYVGDSADDTVSKFDSEGHPILSWGAAGRLSGFGALKGIAVDASGVLFVLERTENSTVQWFNPDGASHAAPFAVPRETYFAALAVDGEGNLYKLAGLGAEVTKFSSSGELLAFSLDGSEQPVGLAVDPSDDNLYVVHSAAGGSVAQFALNCGEGCTPLDSFGAGHLSAPQGVAVDAGSGRVYVADAGSSEIAVFKAATLPDSSTGEASEITPASARLAGTVDAVEGPQATCEFQYSSDESFSESAPCEPPGPFTGSAAQAVSAQLGTLQPATTYHYRLVAENENGANRGEARSFRTSGPPGIEETSSSAITPTCATLEAEVNPNGLETSVLFEYGTAAGVYGSQTTAVSIGSSDEAQNAAIEVCGLTLATTYHFRALATNSAAPAGLAGPDRALTTLPAVSIAAESVSQVTDTSARLQSELSPNGAATDLHFEYDTVPYLEGEPPHGLSTATLDAGSGSAPVSRAALIEGLAPATTYHYRVVAHNSLGTVDGADHAFTTQGTVPAGLPDGRGWELVSPPDKSGVPLEAINREGGVIQAAAEGQGLAYFAKGPIDPQPAGSRSVADSQFLATRGAAGWSSRDLTTPHEEVAGFSPGHLSEYQLFSAGLSLGAVQPAGSTLLAAGALPATPYLRQPGGDYLPLIDESNTPAGTELGEDQGQEFVTGTPDLSHLILHSHQALTPGFTAGGKDSLYEWSAGALTLVSQVPPPAASQCGGSGPHCSPAATEGEDATAGAGGPGAQVRNAISSEGSRVFFEASAEGKGDLYLRDLPSGETLQLDAAQGGPEGGGGTFQTASENGSKAFFTDTRQLTADSSAQGGEPDLYMCEVGVSAGRLACDLTDLSADHNAGESADLIGAVIGADRSGRYVYFVADGVLAQGATHGTCLSAGGTPPPGATCNLYMTDTVSHATTLVAKLAAEDEPDWGTGLASLPSMTARVSPDGRYLAFMSKRSLTGYDNRDAKTGQPDEEVYLYHAPAGGGEEGSLRCASCNPTGARPLGLASGGFPGPLVDRQEIWSGPAQRLAASIPGWTPNRLGFAVYQSRYLSDSGRLFFNAADALVPQDSNATADVYEYEPPQGPGRPASNSCTITTASYSPTSGGCLGLISSGTSKEESAFLDASENGNDVFFLTTSKLAPADVDSALDIYDAHVCTAELPCPPPPPSPPTCAGDACQQPATPPIDATPGSLTFQGAGNLLQCPKGKVKKSGKCLTRKQKVSHKKHAKKRANSNRGGHK